ncbi:MAG: hypothetical protein H6736_03715 [Alphaproteobacteria bacterium]|nr:hypothetical protein [Alphaproteobacteria bacterium]
MRFSFDALVCVLRGDRAAFDTLVSQPEAGTLAMEDFGWALWWWAEAAAPEDRWRTVVQRWPADRRSPLIPWVLARARDRADGAARREAIERALHALDPRVTSPG